MRGEPRVQPLADSRSVLICFLGDPTNDRRVGNFAIVLRERGWKVSLFFAIPGIETSATRQVDGIRLVQLPSKHSSGPLLFWEYSRRLSAALALERSDVVIASDLYSLSAAAKMRREGRVQVLCYDSREVYTELPTLAGRPIAKRVWKFIERRGLSASDCLLVTGPIDAVDILNIHRAVPRTFLLRNLPLRKEQIVPDRDFLRGCGIAENQKVLLYVGGLQPGRGLEKMIEAMPLIQEAVLLIVGGGVLAKVLPQRVAQLGLNNRVIFAGTIESDRVLAIAAACDVGISLIEPISRSYELALPSKLFEYMMAGLPVVSTRLEQVTALFDGQSWLEFADVNSIDSISNATNRALHKSADLALRSAERELSLAEYHFIHDAEGLIASLELGLRDGA